MSPDRAIVDLADKYNALTYRRGPCGGHVRRRGGGISDGRGRAPADRDRGTLGKAFGVMGGYIAA
jgi:7-keto-8-aminopelargonate synthetase-like enzyme